MPKPKKKTLRKSAKKEEVKLKPSEFKRTELTKGKKETADKSSQETEKLHNKYVSATIIIAAIVLLIIFLITSASYLNNHFEYKGLKFEKTMFDKLPFYYTKIQVARPDETIVNYNLYLRNDPRANNIPVYADIKFQQKVAVTTDDFASNCTYSGVSGVMLGQFLNSMGIEIYTGTTDFQRAKETGMRYIECVENQNYTLISIKQGDETRITQTYTNCYNLEIANCELLNTTEKFIMAGIEQARGYY
ncbi:hypothetical protein COV16_00610 [Candidatus Woesearchaeota archaeon CG10_big_fil_rev_8_21_14_0_10_34_8]|nr:MAG: hypothetical protein COV16_00610 [Candidatus Woesearchaeota archaeon CG10_big_fil_rev_8_21_14_0_10_34_8]